MVGRCVERYVFMALLPGIVGIDWVNLVVFVMWDRGCRIKLLVFFLDD